ncbi:MAG TPA: flavodoxin domain-containing protein [Anaerolineaceae bacterium]
MKKVLIAYSTNSGSTREVAEVIATELERAGLASEVKRIGEVGDLAAYDGIIVGAPMIFGWHKEARAFLKRHQVELANRKCAYFACAMRLTQVDHETLPPVELTIDPNLASKPVKAGSLSLKERFTTIGYYLKPMLKAAPAIKPAGIAFFNGKLDYRRLKWWQAAFVMLIVQGTPGDYRDWDTITAWGRSISQVMAQAG